MEIAASYLVNYTTWIPSDFWCVLITILFLISFFSFCLFVGEKDRLLKKVFIRVGLGTLILAVTWTYIYQTKIVENYHYYQVQEIYIHDYDISLKTYMEDYEILDSTPVSITVRSRDWKNEYPELVGKKTDFDIKTIDAENNPLGKDN